MKEQEIRQQNSFQQQSAIFSLKSDDDYQNQNEHQERSDSI